MKEKKVRLSGRWKKFDWEDLGFELQKNLVNHSLLIEFFIFPIPNTLSRLHLKAVRRLFETFEVLAGGKLLVLP
jgi:hypothetical protein